MKIVRTFATSANLGPGFDCLGICFDLYNEYEFFLSDKYTIEGFSEKFSNPSDNLIVKSYEKVFLLKNKKMIERRVIEKEEDGRLRDYTQYRIQPDVYEVLKPSYDQFYSIIGD